MSFLVDCSFRYDFQRAFPGAELPLLAFLSSFEDDSGYCMSTRECIKQDESRLREEKAILEQKLDQIGFTLDWLERNKEELLRINETERLYENADEETDNKVAMTELVYENSDVGSTLKCPERPPMPSPRHGHATAQTRKNEMTPASGPSEIHQELEEIMRKTPNRHPGLMKRSPTEGNTQSTDTFSRKPSSSSDLSLIRSKQNGAPVCRRFLFTVTMNTDSGFSVDKDKLSSRQNETLDVIEEWSTPMQQFYRVRNSSGHLGVIPKHLCQPGFSDQPVLWGRPWFHQKMTRQQAESLLSSCSEGSFLIRDSRKEIGNFVLSLKTRSSVGHFVITSHAKGYKFCNKEFVSFEVLINYFREHPLDKGTRLISSPVKLTS